jgi:hypothetical protein
MVASLEWPRLKVERAGEHLAELHQEVERFLGSGAFRSEAIPRTKKYLVSKSERGRLDPASAEEEDGTGLYMFRVHTAAEPPTRIGLLIGDCLHNLRSGLDHLVWQLILQSGGSPDEKSE